MPTIFLEDLALCAQKRLELAFVLDFFVTFFIKEKSKKEFHRSFDDNRPLLQDDTLIQDVKSFPVYIANLSDTKTASIEIQDGSFMMIVEAMDEHHTWRAIEYWSHSWCGNSYYSLDIPPRHFAFTRGVKCSGDFMTSCRLKVFNGEDSLYSNTFKMSINTNQFNQPVSTKER